MLQADELEDGVDAPLEAAPCLLISSSHCLDCGHPLFFLCYGQSQKKNISSFPTDQNYLTLLPTVPSMASTMRLVLQMETTLSQTLSISYFFIFMNYLLWTLVCVLAAFKNHRPEHIYFHTNVAEFKGRYWEKLKNTPGLRIQFKNVTLPEKIFGQKFSAPNHRWHAGDVTRIKILMEY